SIVANIPRFLSLPGQPKTHLDHPRQILDAADHAKRGIRGHKSRAADDRVVERVKQREAALESEALPDGKLLDSGEVDVIRSVSSQVSKGKGEGANIGRKLLVGGSVVL